MAIVAVGVAFFLGCSDNRRVWITEVRISDFRLYLHASNCACTSKVASFPGPAHTEKRGEPGIFSHMGAMGAINRETQIAYDTGSSVYSIPILPGCKCRLVMSSCSDREVGGYLEHLEHFTAKRGPRF